MPSGVIFNVQRCSFHDGPGVRTTVFLKGCPLHCPWCHNPEGIEPAPQVMLNAARCISCGACRLACPLEQGPLGPGQRLGEGACVACRRCVDACPTGAREVAGKPWSVAEVLGEVLRDRAVYQESGGGVTFSGGEPLAQAGFLLACLAACREAGVHTAVDTCGFAPREVALEVARSADLLLWDLKVLDPARHLALTGVTLEPVLENLAAVAAAGTPIWLRLPLLAGVNDGEDAIGAAVELAAATPGVEKVSLLAYHCTGVGKLGRLGLAGPFPGLATPAPQSMEALAARFATRGLDVSIGG